MEHNAIQWLGAPSCQRGSYAFYKSVSSRAQPDGPVQVWRLGEFYFIRCRPQDPVCIAEVTLLWEEQSRRHLLASARLYFLPEDTPKGRTREHGEDEVLAVSRKMVIRVEDLVRWSCAEPAGWSSSMKINGSISSIGPIGSSGSNGCSDSIGPIGSSGSNGCSDSIGPIGSSGSNGSSGSIGPIGSSGSNGSSRSIGPIGSSGSNGSSGSSGSIGPISSSGSNGSNGSNGSSSSIGSIGSNSLHKPPQSNDGNNNTPDKSNKPLRDITDNGSLAECQAVKVLSYPQYCRYRSLQRRIQDGARGPELQDPHLLALGGIKVLPSTRLMYCRDTFNHPTLESSASFAWQFRCPSLSLRGRPRKRRGRDCRDSPNSSQSESWIERMKENVMGSVEVGCEGSWLPHPEEQLFLDQLYAFMDRQGSPIHKVPNLGFKKIDLFLMYSVVKRLGGYNKVTTDRMWKVVYNELGGCPGSTSAATCTRRHYERLMLPYEEHLRAGGAEFKVPESPPPPPKPRVIRGRKPLPRGRKPGPKAKDKKMVNPNGSMVVKRGRGRPPGTRNKATLIAQARMLAQQQAKVKTECLPLNALIPGKVRGGPTASNTHRPIQPALLPVNMPLTPDLSPMSTPFLPFQPKPKDLKPDRGQCGPPGVVLSTLPRHFVGGSLGGFSPIKGVCPLDVFRSRISLQRGLESPALTPQDPTQLHPTIFTLQPKAGSPDPPQPSGEPQPHQLHQHHNRCSGCSPDDGGQRGGGRDPRSRPPLPPLRVLPLNLDCSVQVCQLMRTRCLDSSQLQSFTRRLSEALSQDLSPKPPCSPITPPPEQALPLNLSKRFVTKRPGAEGPEPSRAAVNGTAEQLSSKRPRTGFTEQAEDFSLGGRSSSTGAGAQEVEAKNQEEPADLSSPSRIRAFLLGLPPFQVKLEEDLNGMRFDKFLPPGSESETQMEGGMKTEDEERIKSEQEERDPGSELQRSGNADTTCF